MKKRTVLVTGAARGIGKAISEKFAQAGYEVLAPSRTELDLSSDASVDNYLKRLEGLVDVIINNAGINRLGELSEAKDNDIEDTLRIDLISPLRLIRGIIPAMANQGYGRIVNISSIWGEVSKPGRGVYSIAKSGLNALTRSLAVELANNNILVNSVSPGFVDTELTRQNNTPQQIETIRAQIPLGRLAGVKEIAEIVFFLGSDLNTYITGQNVIIDGGYTCL
jgi:3-oxoacyl-[acyl-carrier protein] reductase